METITELLEKIKQALLPPRKDKLHIYTASGVDHLSGSHTLVLFITWNFQVVVKSQRLYKEGQEDAILRELLLTAIAEMFIAGIWHNHKLGNEMREASPHIGPVTIIHPSDSNKYLGGPQLLFSTQP